ncbi:MAG: hypothetical protein R3288_08455 [Woeseiaceae bacterium]|nr:hypothetical protein [Woeseiaceae bacterium]
MKYPILILIVTMFVTADAAPTKAERKARCAVVKAKIRHIESRMRAGYSASQGIRLEERLRKLKYERYRVCR